MSSSSSSSKPAATAAGPVLHALSCVNCRQRKVKCAKTYPCPHCVRGGLECVFPTRKKDRAPRRSRNHELLNRLAKLEAIVGGQASPEDSSVATVTATSSSPLAIGEAGQDVSAAVMFGAGSGGVASAPPVRREADLARNAEKRCPTAAPASRNDPAAKYVSGEFWANLASEVEGIKAALDGPSDNDDDDNEGSDVGIDETSPSGSSIPAGQYNSPGSSSSSAAVFSILGAMHGAIASPKHPAPERIKKLREVYFRNVDPLLKVLHRPTVEREFDLFIVNPEDNPPDKQTEALFFAIYFAAVTSLGPERCVEVLGEERAPLSARYRQGVEFALARADYLNSTSLETLQALTIYDACLRNHAESRASWALLALVYRLAQAIGLHRDGSGKAFSPYEAELRRRLWAQIVVLDVRAAQDRGTEPMISEEDYNTLPPTNINDDAFHTDTSVPIPALAVDGPTGITFSLCTYRCSSLFLYIHGPRSKFFKDGSSSSAASSVLQPTTAPQQASEEDIITRIKSLETQFILPAAQHPTHFPSALAASVVRLTTLIFWLTIQYPFRTRQPTIKPRVPREHMLQTAVAIIDLQAFGPTSHNEDLTAEYRDRFAWWADGYVQWHPLAVALAELCVQTDGPLVERAWATVDRVFPVWSHKVADRKRGALWRPIRKLYRRAREKRTAAQMRRLGIQDAVKEAANVQKALAGRNTELPHVPATPPPRPNEGGPSPLAAATEMGPTGIPMETDWGDDSAAGGEPAVPQQALLYENAHNLSWTTIDFGAAPTTLAADGLGAGVSSGAEETLGGATQLGEFETMDWSAWNDFVNDANVDLGDGTSPSSEGR